MDFNTLLFRSSANGHLMTDPKSKADKDAGNLSEGAKTHLVDIYVREKYGRQTDVSNKFIEKGLMVEEDSITLYCRANNAFYKKNEEHLENEFIKGTPDMYAGKSIKQATHVIDVKSSWDLFTFSRVRAKKLNDLYYWQLQSYMALTGAKTATLAYCLINTPDCFINDEKRKVFYKMGIATTEDPVYQEACEHLDLAMVYDDIPLNERVIQFEIERNDEDIQKLYDRIKKARIWLAELDEKVSPKQLQLAS